MMKSCFISIVCLAFLQASAFADIPNDGDNFYVYTKGVTNANVYSLDILDKLTFDDNTMSVWTSTGKTDYAYSDIALLTFREEMKPSGIETLTIGNDVQISYDRESMLVIVQSSKPLTGLAVFNLQGRMVGSLQHQGDQLQLSLAGLPQGVYVVKAQGTGFGKSVKIIK
jgi:hypothetical protein